MDFALWGGLTPINLDKMEELADAGAIGFKAFMSRSGTPDFPHSDAKVLKRGMKTAVACGLPVAVHAEDDLMTYALAEERRSQGKIGWRDYLDRVRSRRNCAPSGSPWILLARSVATCTLFT